MNVSDNDENRDQFGQGPTQSPEQPSTSKTSPTENRIRRRAGTWGGRPSGSSQRVDTSGWKHNLLGVKKKFSRKNAWGNCSYKALIIEAIEQSSKGKLTLNEIYDWIVENIPHFRGEGETNSSAGWKNSIRHNLSLHPVFVKEPQFQQNGTKAIGCYWVLDKSREPRKRCHTIDPTQKDMAVRRKRNQTKQKANSPGSISQNVVSPANSLGSTLENKSIENTDSGMSRGSSQSSLDFPSFKTDQLIQADNHERQKRIASLETTSSMEMSKSSPTNSIPKYDYDSYESPKMETNYADQELIDVQVTVPGELFHKYANNGYTFFVMDKCRIPANLKQNIIQNPNPTPVDQFHFTPPVPSTVPQPTTIASHSMPIIKSEAQINTFSELSIKDELLSDVAFDSLITTDDSGLSQLIDFDQLF